MRLPHHLIVCALFVSTHVTALPDPHYRARDLYPRAGTLPSQTSGLLPQRSFTPGIVITTNSGRNVEVLFKPGVAPPGTEAIRRAYQALGNNHAGIEHGWMEVGVPDRYYPTRPINRLPRGAAGANPASSSSFDPPLSPGSGPSWWPDTGPPPLPGSRPPPPPGSRPPPRTAPSGDPSAPPLTGPQS